MLMEKCSWSYEDELIKELLDDESPLILLAPQHDSTTSKSSISSLSTGPNIHDDIESGLSMTSNGVQSHDARFEFSLMF